MYVCPCTDERCCIRLCMPCRDGSIHRHGMLSHFIMSARAAGGGSISREPPKLKHRKTDYRILSPGDDPNCGHALMRTNTPGRYRCAMCGATMEEAHG